MMTDSLTTVLTTNLKTNLKTSLKTKRALGLARILVVCLASGPGLLLADPTLYNAIFDPAAGPNEFIVNFPPELGGQTIHMPIVGGSLALEVDESQGTAILRDWHQDLAPIDLFGFSTGPITVTTVGEDESEGTFNASTSTFAVTAVFAVTFDDSQLSQFGFVSPFHMTATELGSIVGVGPSGRISMSIEGGGSVAGSAFSYTCRTNARFDIELSPSQAQAGDANRDRSLDMSDPVAMLAHLYLGRAASCPAAGEVNGDLKFDLSDPVYLLNYLFIGGPPPGADIVECE